MIPKITKILDSQPEFIVQRVMVCNNQYEKYKEYGDNYDKFSWLQICLIEAIKSWMPFLV